MQIVIAGGVRIGRGLAKRLGETKHDVIIIDADKTVCEEIYSEYGAVTIHGSATDLRTLKNSNVESSDVAVAAMRYDSRNLTFALLAKHLGVPNIHVRMADPNYEPIYKSVGVTNIGRVSDLLIEQFMVNIETPELRKVMSLGNLEIGIVVVPSPSELDGKRIGELTEQSRFPQALSITCLYQGSNQEFIVPNDETTIYSGDRIFLCGAREDLKTVSRMV